jgi:hypothetical protein
MLNESKWKKPEVRLVDVSVLALPGGMIKYSVTVNGIAKDVAMVSTSAGARLRKILADLALLTAKFMKEGSSRAILRIHNGILHPAERGGKKKSLTQDLKISDLANLSAFISSFAV